MRGFLDAGGEITPGPIISVVMLTLGLTTLCIWQCLPNLLMCSTY